MAKYSIDLGSKEWYSDLYLPILYDDNRYILLYGGRDCMAPETEVVMHDGTILQMQYLKVGDQLLGKDGLPRTIQDIHNGKDQLYKINQSNGCSYIVNSKHKLCLKRSRNAKNDKGEFIKYGYRRPNGYGYSYGDYPILGVEDFISKSKKFKDRFRGYKTTFIFPSKNVSIDPYFLGIWLGDGSSNLPHVTTMDKEIVDCVYHTAKQWELNVSLSTKPNNKASTYRIVNQKYNGLKRELENKKLIYNKHIPHEYFYNDENKRLELLAGMIDTDGSLGSGNRNSFVISQKNKKLLLDFKLLADSLGFCTRFKKFYIEIRNEDIRPYYKLNISGDIKRIPVRIPRKKPNKTIIDPTKKRFRKYLDESILNIGDAGHGEYIGIELDGDHQYLLKDGTVVHNSAKSYTAAQKIILDTLGEAYCKTVCLRKIYADIRDSQFETLWSVIESWNLQQYFKYTVSPLRIVCTLNNNSILARGLDRSAKLKSIKDITKIWGEEADEFQLKDFITSDTSMRSSNPNSLLQFILSFNPEQEEGWINDYFFPPKQTYEEDDGSHHFIESTQPNTTILHSTYKDNEFCPSVRGERYERLANISGIDDNFYRVFCLGLWGNALKGLVFDNVRYPATFPDIKDCKIHGYGLDYGFTNDPTAIVECALAHGQLWFRELCYKTGLVNTGDKHSIESELKKHEVGRKEIIAESAEPKSNEEIRRKGFNIRAVRKGRGSIEAGISSMKAYPINIVGSPNMKKEAKSYKYALDKQGNPTNTPIDAWNHLFDASRYWYMEKIMKPKKQFRAEVL